MSDPMAQTGSYAMSVHTLARISAPVLQQRPKRPGVTVSSSSPTQIIVMSPTCWATCAFWATSAPDSRVHSDVLSAQQERMTPQHHATLKEKYHR